MTLIELIAALERAEGPQAGLDYIIAALVFPDDSLQRTMPRPYTASLEAALTLVPEGWEWIVFGGGGADVWRVSNDDVLHRIDETYAATPAIAVCIAALKARLP